MYINTASIPIRGWNSYDGYGASISEAEALENLEIFLKKLKPAGYEYFCLDAAWYADGGAEEWSRLAAEGKYRYMHMDAWGRYIPSPERFPSGLKKIAGLCHQAGVKFGVHMMRGLPRRAVQENTPVLGTNYHAQDLYDPENDCLWCKYWASAKADHPGTQAFYNSEVEYLANELEVDFIKLDDVTEHPGHVELFANAIARVERPIVLSLSPGNEVWDGTYRAVLPFANMMRTTGDVWDEDADNLRKLERWYALESCNDPRCRLDFEKIPMGGLQVNVPQLDKVSLGQARQSRLTAEGKRTLMTILAMTGSPLIFGGALPFTPEEDLALVTHPGMLACQQACQVGRRMSYYRHLDIRRSVSREDENVGWIGLFNTTGIDRLFHVSAEDLGLSAWPELTDVWTGQPVKPGTNDLWEAMIPANGSCFWKYHILCGRKSC